MDRTGMRIGFPAGHQRLALVDGNPHRNHGTPGPDILFDPIPGPPRQTLDHGQPHPMNTKRSTGGIAADPGLEGFSFVERLETDDVVQDIGELFDLRALFRVSLGNRFHRSHNFKDDPFKGNGVLLVDGFLETTDGFDVGRLGRGPIFQVKDFQA